MNTLNQTANTVKDKRIIFAGTALFALPTLQALVENGWNVIALYTQPDRPSGRGKKIGPGPLKEYALAHGIDVFQPHNFKSPDSLDTVSSLQSDLMVVVAYGLILPTSVLHLPRLGCVNIHASILPRWRGAAPIQRAIEAGDDETGVSIMQMDEGLDTGPIYSTFRMVIPPTFSAGELHDELAACGASELLRILPNLLSEAMPLFPQAQNGVTYAEKLTKNEACIQWSETSESIALKVRAYNTWPVVFFQAKSGPIRVLRAEQVELDSIEGLSPGDVISADKNGIVVQCGVGAIRLKELQFSGKKAMKAVDVLNGHARFFRHGKPIGTDSEI